MEDTEGFDSTVATVAGGMLLIWWGIVIITGPLTIGLGAVGTGLILLGANGARRWKGVPTRAATTAAGIVALTWGALDHLFALRILPSAAVLMIIVGLVVLSSHVRRLGTA